MPFVLSEKFRIKLQLEVKSSVFLECSSVRDVGAVLPRGNSLANTKKYQ